MSTVDSAEIHALVGRLSKRYGDGAGSVLNVLNDIQSEYRYVPIEALYELARTTNCSFASLCSVVSAFEDLTTEPVGEHLVLVCDGTACHAAGAVDVIRALEDKLGIVCGTTGDDGKYTLKSVYCVGACSLAPIAIVDGASFGRIRLSRLDEALGSLEGGGEQ